MGDYSGYTDDLEDMDTEELQHALDRARLECARGCLDMEGMSARVNALETALIDASFEENGQ